MMKILAVIPARYASTRFPAKPLADLGGQSMIERVYKQVLKSSLVTNVLVATDHEAIYSAVTNFGGKAVMTSTEHRSGTDRCMEAYELSGEGYDYVLNVQGDEPFIKPTQIDLLAATLDGQIEIATLVKRISEASVLSNPSIVKAVRAISGDALYFSRSSIPFFRGKELNEWPSAFSYWKHIGMYAYRTDILKKLTQLQPSPLEIVESLEQLRWLENGFRITTHETLEETIGIDTPEDLKHALDYLESNKNN